MSALDMTYDTDADDEAPDSTLDQIQRKGPDGPTRSMAVARVESPRQAQTPAQARVDSVSRTMDAAMNRASTLTLTPEEVAALKADFPDEAFKPGAAGKENLIYIEHAFLRDRLDTVVGMGQWAILRTRPHWAEEFTTQKGEKATRIYADCALLVRGCMVAESIGDMVYYPNNASQNYGDAAEGAVTAAFRRCAKNFGVGLQAWKKDWCEGWWQRKRGSQTRPSAPPRAPEARGGIGFAKPANDASEAAEAILEPPAPAPEAPKLTPKQRADAFLDLLKRSKSRFLSQVKPILAPAERYFQALPHHGIMPNEALADIPPSSLFPSADVEATAEANHAALRADFERHMAGIKAVMAADDQLPGAEIDLADHDQPEYEGEPKPEPQARKPMPAGAESKRIRVVATGSKPGQSARGPWTRYWIKDSEDTYYSTFDKTLGAQALEMKDSDATVWFTAEAKGNTLHGIDICF